MDRSNVHTFTLYTVPCLKEGQFTSPLVADDPVEFAPKSPEQLPKNHVIISHHHIWPHLIPCILGASVMNSDQIKLKLKLERTDN